MAIFERVNAGMTEAMKARNAARLAALRSIRAAFLNEMKTDNSQTLSDEVCTGLLRRLEKQRGESIEAFEKAGRPDRVAEERAGFVGSAGIGDGNQAASGAEPEEHRLLDSLLGLAARTTLGKDFTCTKAHSCPLDRLLCSPDSCR